MAGYLPRLRITVAHGYYASGLARGLRFEPDADTAAWLATNDCIWRNTGSGVDLAAPPARAALPHEPPRELTWFVHCTDRPFMNVTAGLPRDPGSLLVFRPPASLPSDAQTGQRLHAGDHVGPADLWATHPPGVLAAEPSVARQVRMPAFLVRVPAPALGSAAQPQARYRIAFAARSPVWKYRLLGDWSADPLRIEDAAPGEDPAKKTRFDDPVDEQLDTGQPALSIRSQSGIALRERPDNRFQLRSRSAVADRVLVKRLPVAGADHLARDTTGDALISEIFVYR